jgi:TPR repeat protein
MQQVCHNIRFFSVLLLFISITASADEIDVGMKAYNDGDYATAYEILLPLAEHHGYARAMNTLGIMYEQGLGTEKQGAEALKWYKKASLEGNSEGM